MRLWQSCQVGSRLINSINATRQEQEEQNDDYRDEEGRCQSRHHSTQRVAPSTTIATLEPLSVHATLLSPDLTTYLLLLPCHEDRHGHTISGLHVGVSFEVGGMPNGTGSGSVKVIQMGSHQASDTRDSTMVLCEGQTNGASKSIPAMPAHG